jgi:hypothetical protein
MTVERRGQNSGPPADPQRAMNQALIKFALIDGIGVLAMFGFLVAFFILDYFPGQPMGLLFVALAAFAAWALLALKLSGLLDAIRKKGSSDAR